jgi:putative salt-induced outer membrane protein YdiY
VNRLGLVTFMVALIAAPAIGQERESQSAAEILEQEQALVDAIRARDRARLDTLLADNYVQRGAPDMQRSVWIDDALTQCWGDRSAISGFRVQPFVNSVVATFELTLHADSGQCTPSLPRLVITDVWAREDDRWVLELRHATALAPPAPAPSLKPSAPPGGQRPRAWDLKGELSLIATAGNTSAQTLGLASEASHQSGSHLTRGNIAFLTSEADGVTKARSLTAQARHGFHVGPRLELFGRVGYARDRFAGIQHRSTGDFGTAYSALVPKGHTLILEAGVGFASEQRLSATDFRFATATGTINHSWLVSSNVALSDRLDVVADLATARNWRATSAVSLTVSLTRRVSLKVSQAVEYRNLPVPGFQRADMRSSAALVLAMSGRSPAQ